MKEDYKNNMYEELPDSVLENVSGGVNVGDTVTIRDNRIDYCPNCGKLLTRYEATITGVRGVLDGNTVYWITRKCCGYKSSVIDTAIVK